MKIFRKKKLNKGMTYVELIVVLSIFSILSSVAIFNYGDFQSQIDIKNLTSDIALNLIKAQRAALSGNLPVRIYPNSWRPAYGVYFTTTANSKADNQSFIYFADLNSSNYFSDEDCDTSEFASECLEKILITKGNQISEVRVDGLGCPDVTNLNVTFRRPDSQAYFWSDPSFECSVNYAEITVLSPDEATATIKVYPSGRIQVD